MQEQESGFNSRLRPIELLEQFPGEPFAASDRLQWEGLVAFRYRNQPPNEALQPALTHHSLVLLIHTPQEFEFQCDGVDLVVPPRPGSVMLVPAANPARWRWSSHCDSLHVFLKPDLVARVAAEAFECDPACVVIPPLDGLQVPQLRTAMLAVNDEMTSDAAGSRLAAESLAHLLAVHLIRNTSAARLPTRRTSRRTESALPSKKLRAVVEYIEEHLDAGLTLEQMASAAHLSAYHFARQFKAATGMPPHQYVLARRVDRAQRFLQSNDDLSLAEIAARVGFSDQSQFTHHFKRVIGVTPHKFRRSASIA